MSDPRSLSAPDRPTVLAAAGVDPSGGAGLLQDVWVLRQLGIHGVAVATAIAVQNSTEFQKTYVLDTAMIRDQLKTLTVEFPFSAVKTGMLGSPEAVEVLADWLGERPRLPLVLDPVLTTSTGGNLNTAGYVDTLRKVLIPRATVVAPNLYEAQVLTGLEVSNREQVPVAARGLRDLGAAWVLITGGHLSGRDKGSDFLLGPDTELWIEGESKDLDAFRGTGCAFASALTAGIAHGETVPEASEKAKGFVQNAMDAGYTAGRGLFLGTPGESEGS